MKTPSLSRCLALLATSLFALPAHGQYGGYSYSTTYPTGSLTALSSSNSYIRVQVPIERVGHSFTLSWHATNGSAVTTVSIYNAGLVTSGAAVGEYAQVQSLLLHTQAPSPAYTYSNGTYTYTYFSAFDWWLNDTTASQKSEVKSGTPGGYNGTSYTYSGILSGPWTQVSGVANRYFAIHESRLSHSLGVRDGTSWTTVSASGTTLNTYSNGTSGTTVPLHWFTGSATGAPSSTTAFIGDLTTAEKTTPGLNDVRSSTVWVVDPNYLFYPYLDAHVTLEAREAGHNFTVHSRASGGPEMQRVFAAGSTTGGAVLNFPVAKGVQFWVTRDAEKFASAPAAAPAGASAAGSSWIANILTRMKFAEK